MKPLLSLLFVLSVGVSAFSQEISPANCPLSTVIQVDGQAGEWPMDWLEDDDKHFKYNVCTDDNNIYIRARVKDEMIRRKLGLFGLTVWMDPNGKKKKKLGLKFPSGVEAKERMDGMEKAGPERFKNMTATERADFQKEINKSLVENLEILEIIGLSDNPLTSTRTGITNGIKVAIAADSTGAYVYEAIIPFKSFRLSKASIETLNIGLETGKYVPPPAKTQPSAITPGSPGSINNMSGIGGSGGMGGYGSMGRSRMAGSNYVGGPMANTTGIWIPIKLK